MNDYMILVGYVLTEMLIDKIMKANFSLVYMFHFT